MDIGAVTVHPGDYVLAEGSEVAFRRLEHVEEILTAAGAIAAHGG